MRHIAHIMLGNGAKNLLCELKKYVIKYGETEELNYFSALLYLESDLSSTFKIADVINSDESVFIPGVENLFEVSLLQNYEVPNEERFLHLCDFFTKFYNKHITINNLGISDKLHICLYVPLYDKKYWLIVKEFLSVIDSIEQEFIVDLFLLTYDLAFLFEDKKEELPLKIKQFQEQTQLIVPEIISSKKDFTSLRHIIMMQNCNNQGVSLDLDSNSFIRIIGEYALLSINHYDEIFSSSTEDKNRPIHALGLSVLNFDKYYFVQYLLHKAYVYILDREGILQKEVDVNKVSQIAHQILSKNINIFSSFYDKEIKPLLDKNVSQQDIMVEVKVKLDAEINRLTKDFQSFIEDSELSLPEKKATLAQLIGEDDALLTGYMFNREQFVIDDCSREVLDFFVVENNKLFNMTQSYENDNSEVGNIVDYAVLSRMSNSEQKLPSSILEKLKETKIKMRESSNYIRLKSLELKDIDLQEEERINSEKRLTEHGFIFEGKTYILQTKEEKPFEEDYIPIDNRLSRVDLRNLFTSVKDQGKLGSCSSFAIVSILEYILKKNKSLESDLSEAFVYYWARYKEENNTDEGTSLYNNILTVEKEGVCLEKYYPYKEDFLNFKEPSEEALKDALYRKVKKTLNVRRDVKDIKSALAQGFPVAISLKIFNSFEPIEGFILRPSDDDVQKGIYGNHAMVICGYSDDEKIFIVRNSWGEKFGDKGYCYIPYSYIEDFMNVGCIITEMDMDDILVAGNDIKTIVSFDMANARIKSAILRNLINEEKHYLNVLDANFQRQDFAYHQIFQTLGNNAVRTAILDGTLIRLMYKKNRLEKEQRESEENRIRELNLFDKLTNKGVWVFAGFWGLFILVYLVLLVFSKLSIVDVLLNSWSYLFYAIIAVVSILFYFWEWQRKRKRRDLDIDYQSIIEYKVREIQECDRQLSVVKLKSHIAGMIIDSLFKLFRNLHSKYNCMHSYVGNLLEWRGEEVKKIERISENVREPFFSLISNYSLEKYFQDCKDEITRNIKLYETFSKSYKVDDTEIIRFKNKLKKNLIEELFNKISDFSVYNHISNSRKYSYVLNSDLDIGTLLQQMDVKSNCFLRTKSVINTDSAKNTSCKFLFVDADIQSTRKYWNGLCKNNFQNMPIFYNNKSHYKMTLLRMVGLAVDEIVVLDKK